MAISRQDSIIGCLLGTAVGDAIGLPAEGLSRQRLARLYPQVTGHHFFFNRGMVSDDTEHTCMVAQALLVSGGEVNTFRKSLAWRLRFWLLGLPASIGLATARALVKLWLGYSPERSGVFSAGNGPAMRSAILGASLGHDAQKMRKLVRASTLLTHRDPKAEYGSLAVALAAHLAAAAAGERIDPDMYCQTLQGALAGEPASELLDLVRQLVDSIKRDEPTERFAESLGQRNGVSGYVYHTVPVALHAWLRNQQNFRIAIAEIIRCGGDADSTAAIVGGVIGAGVGKEGIPKEWIDGLWEWPRTVKWMEELGRRLAQATARGTRQRALSLSVAGLFVRNLFFLVVVLAHGFRRLLPPY